MTTELICLLTGLTDVPLQDLGGLTPLDKAQTPLLDQLMASGELHRQEVDQGTSLETAFLHALGIDVELSHSFAEAYAGGITLAPGQVAYSVRLVSAGEGTVVDVSDALVGDAEGEELCQALNAGVGRHGVHFIHLRGPQAVCVARAELFSELTTQGAVHPVKSIGKRWKQGGFFEACEEVLSAHAINLMREDLEEDPVNALLIYDRGVRPEMQLPEGAGGVCISASGGIRGAARLLGMQARRWPQEERRFNRVPALLDELEAMVERGEPRIVLDVPYFWEATYKGDLLEKIKVIEWFDQHILPKLVAMPTQLRLHTLKHCDIRQGMFVSGEGVSLMVENNMSTSVSRH